MNKVFEYRGYKFNIKVELNTRTERRMDGERWHTVTTNCMGFDNYYSKAEVQDDVLILKINAEEILAKEYIDKKLDGNPSVDQRLTEMGFK